jgi:hypothetical protein
VAFVKIWIGAAVAVALFLTIQALLEQRADHIARTPVVQRTWCNSLKQHFTGSPM